MELLKYDDKEKTFTLTLEQGEFLDIHSVLGGVLNTYKQQDPLIIGVHKDRLRTVMAGLRDILQRVNAAYCK